MIYYKEPRSIQKLYNIHAENRYILFELLFTILAKLWFQCISFNIRFILYICDYLPSKLLLSADGIRLAHNNKIFISVNENIQKLYL